MKSYPTLPSRRRYFLRAGAGLLCATALLGCQFFYAIRAEAARRPGAARTLRITGTDPQRPGQPWRSDDAAGDSSLSEPVFAPGQTGGGAELYFTRTSGGAKNLWRARMALSDSAASPPDEGEARLPARSAVLEATPLTRLTAPWFAASAAPLPDGRAVLCVTNNGLSETEAAAGRTVIARIDIGSGRFTALTSGAYIDSSPAVSPDGRRFAWVSERDGFPSIYLQNFQRGEPERISTLARNPRWLDSETLIFESTQPGTGGLYRVTLKPGARGARPQFLWKRAGLTATSHNGRWLAVSARTEGQGAPSRLYLLAPDGSGARAVNTTDGARGAAFAPGDSVIVFDAPRPEAGASERRTLWMLPMLRVNPTASLASVRAPRGVPVATAGRSLEIVGSVFTQGGNPAEVKLEWGEGDEPTRWQPIAVAAEAANSAVLARWSPPQNEGSYTFRLTVTDADGDSSESLLTVTLPIEPPAEPASAPVFALNPPGTPPPGARPPASPPAASPPATPPSPASPAKAAPVKAAPVKPAPVATTRAAKPASPRIAAAAPVDQRIALSTVPRLPLPALPPAPARPTQAPEAGPRDPGPVAARAPERASDPAPPIASPGATARPAPAARPAAAARREPERPPTQGTAPAPQPAPRAAPAKAPVQRQPGDAASLSVAGVPMSMAPGEVAPLEATIRNTGANGWKNNSNAPVRLLIYWRDLKSGRRTRWYIRWLRADVPPGGTTKLSFDLIAPPRAGRYQLRFCLVRVPGGSYTPPPITQPTMPGEFGVASTTMDVE